MKLFNIYDSWGNVIGEISEYDPDLGFGCFGSVFAAFLGIIAPVAIWYAWYTVSFSEWSSDTDRMMGVLSMALMLITVVIYGIKAYKEEKYSFSKVFGEIIVAITLIDGLIMWLIACVAEGEYEFGILLASFFIFFLLSLGMGFGGAVGIALIRRIFKK